MADFLSLSKSKGELATIVLSSPMLPMLLLRLFLPPPLWLRMLMLESMVRGPSSTGAIGERVSPGRRTVIIMNYTQ